MKKVIGWILLTFVFASAIFMTCSITGFKEGFIIWGLSFIIAMIVAFAIFLIENGD